MKQLLSILETVKHHSKSTYIATIFCLILAGLSTIGMIFDERTLLGVNVYLKPFKFAISTAIYIFSIGYFTHWYNYTPRKKAIINHVTSWSLSIELVIIVMQGFRGVQSHYNMSSALDGLLFASMGILVGLNVIIMGIFFIDTLRGKPQVKTPMLLALILGWAAIILGSYVGGQMISQISHNVGVADGGSGIPLLNWSLRGGDLRIAHFLGIHAIQLIPIGTYFILKKFSSNYVYSTIASVLYGLAYVSLIGFTFYQAKQGESLISLFL